MSVSPEKETLFLNTCKKVIHSIPSRSGIGTLGEKTVHAVLKHFYEPDISCQEVRIHNFVADIFHENEIFEIQTRSFNTMRRKLDVLLKSYPVTVIYPVIHTKWLHWINEETGEITKKRKSPKTGSRFDAFYELYKIKPFLTHPNFHLRLVLIDAEEYRILNGWSKDRKKGSTRFDRIPTQIIDEICIETPKDYDCMIPDNLPQPFTSADFAKNGKVSIKTARLALNILSYLELVERSGKKGNAFLYYTKRETTENNKVF